MRISKRKIIRAGAMKAGRGAALSIITAILGALLLLSLGESGTARAAASSTPGSSNGGEVITVATEGETILDEAEGKERSLALKDAFRKALTEAIKERFPEIDMEEYSSILDSTILADPVRYIINYRITREGTVTHRDRTASELRVLRSHLLNDISTIPDLLPHPGTDPVEGMAGDPFGTFGPFGNDEPFFDDAVSELLPGEVAPVSSTIEEEERRKEIEVLAAKPVTLYHIWISAEVDGTHLVDDIKELLEIEEDLKDVTMVLLKTGSYERFSRLKESIAVIEGVKRISYSSFNTKRITLVATTRIETEDFVYSLKSTLGSDYVIIPGGGERIFIMAEGREE